MNDIQAKENIYTAATAAVNKQEESVSAATTQVTQAQNAYLQSVVRAATLSEKTRRKKDSLVNLAVYGGSAVIALILLLINVVVGILFIVAVGVIAWIVKQQTSDESVANYNNRKAFFSKYAHAVPANEQLKWKNGSVSYSGSTSYTADGWNCPQCSTKNTNGSNFCVSCGTKKP